MSLLFLSEFKQINQFTSYERINFHIMISSKIDLVIQSIALRRYFYHVLYLLDFKVTESRDKALFMVNGSIKKILLIDFVNVYIYLIFFSVDFAPWKSVELPHITCNMIH